MRFPSDCVRDSITRLFARNTTAQVRATFAPHTHNITIILNELYFNLRRVRGAIIRRSFFFLVTKKKNTVFFFSKYFRNKKPFEKRNAASAEKRRRRSKSYKCKKKKKKVTLRPFQLGYNIILTRYVNIKLTFQIKFTFSKLNFNRMTFTDSEAFRALLHGY